MQLLNNTYRAFLDDSSPTESAPALNVRVDNQGDLYFWITAPQNVNGAMARVKQLQVRLCSPGGGSRYEGLAGKLIGAIAEWERENGEINT